MPDGTSDTWTSQASSTNQSGHARVRGWNNTVGFKGLPKELRPVNGYQDNQMFWEQIPYSLFTTVNSTGNFYPPAYFDVKQPASVAKSVWVTARTGGLTAWTAKQLEIENEAKVKVLGKMADAKVNLAVMYAEAHKTSSLILDTANRIYKAHRAFRKGDLKGVASNLNITPKKLHKSWLEYKYGWMPLLMDVKGSAEFFAQQTLTRKPRFRVTALVSSGKTERGRQDNGRLGGGTTPVWYSDWVLAREYTAKVSLWCELSSPHYSELQQLGLTNPALIAWELVPFSFVFDWFIQVGDYLTALSAFHGVTVLRGCLSTINSEHVDHEWPTYKAADSVYSYFCSGFRRSWTDRLYKRIPFDPHPWDLSIPKTNNFDFPKLVTSLALLRGSTRSVRS